MLTKYTFNVDDFLNNKINSSMLCYEIGLTTTSGLSHINTDGALCDIWFDQVLSSADETTLSGVISSHVGNDIPDISREDTELLLLVNQSINSTTSEEWQTIASREDSYFSGGTYRFAWSYFWKSVTDLAYPYLQVRSYIRPHSSPDEEDTIFIHLEKPTENPAQALMRSGFSYKRVEPGYYDVLTDYKRVGSAGAVVVSDANMEIMKASNTFIGSNLSSSCQDLIDYEMEAPSTPSGIIEVITSEAAAIEGAEIKYYLGGWQSLGYTDANGQIDGGAYADRTAWRCYYGSRYQTLNDQNVLEGITFQTGKVSSSSGNCTHYYAGGWQAFEEGVELLAISYTFKFDDEFPDTAYDINAGETNYIH